MGAPHLTRCVGGIVHDDVGRLLLIQRGTEPALGKWSLPGGRVEPGETDAEAVVRELAEETGLSVRVNALVGYVIRGRYEIYDYLCTVRSGELVAGDDAADVRWVDLAGFAELETVGALSEGLAEALRDWDSLPRS